MMKKITALLLALLFVLSPLVGIPFELPAFAAEVTSGTTGDCTWTLDGTVLTISGNGAMGAYLYPSDTWGTSITQVFIEEGVTKIGAHAFRECGSLTSVIIPDSVTSIGERAFYYCSSLTSTTIPDSVTSIGSYAFYECGSLTAITIGDSVTSIGERAFSGCSSLTDVIIPDSVTSIGSYAFSSCSSLISITIGDGVTSIDDSVFRYCSALNSIAVEEGNPVYHSAGNCLFETESKKLIQGCNASVIPTDGSVTSIGDYAFYGCNNLVSIALSENLTTIGDYAFHGCTKLSSISIPDSVTTIGDFAFTYCKSLTSIAIPENVTIIGNNVFYGCDNLISITLSKNLTTIGGCAFYNCKSLSSISIPDSVTTIGYGAFYYCMNLTTITIPKNVTTIGSIAFSYCANLTSVSLGNSVTTIGDEAFFYCTSLASITIPGSVTNIGDKAFYGCSSLADVWYEGTEENKASISIGISNTPLTSATWHYNICDEEDHIYDNKIDTTCNECGFVRTLPYDSYGTTGDCTWTLDGTVLTISGNGAMGDYLYPSDTWGTSITQVFIDEGVTNIGAYAFYYCSALTSVTIPDSVTSIGDWAFYGCSSLTSVTIPDGVTSIGDSAFSGCTSLESVIIPDSVTSIGYYAFRNCTNLANVYISDLEAWCNISFVRQSPIAGEDDTYLHSNPLFYGAKLYLDGKLVTDLIIPDSITSVRDYLFYNCSSITSVTIPDNVTKIGGAAFSCCKALTSVTIGSGLSSIGYDYWHAHSAFDECASLSSIVVKEENETYHSYGNCLIETKTKKLIQGCNTSVIPSDGSVTSIGDSAFRGSVSLSSITIPDDVTSIGVSAFSGCGSLTSATIPDSVASIGFNAFENCTSLTSVTIPDSVTSIESGTFSNCSSLNTIIIPDSVTSIGFAAFRGCSNLSDVYYTGSEADLEWVSINTYNSDLTSTTWHYNFCAESDTKVHIYDNACDTDCNICGNTRSVPDHTYDNACDSTCNECGTVREVPDHIYDNACDAACNECGLTRSVPDHIYDNVCDTTCNECGTIRSVPDHIYDDACDTDCNICKSLRTAPHIHDNNCDTICNKCGEIRVTLHTPVNGVCTECGQKAVVPVSAKLVLDKYVGVKFYFNKADVDEDFTFLVTLPGRETPLAEGTFSNLAEEGELYVLSFNGISLSDFDTEFTLSGKTLWDPNADRYNSVTKLAKLGADYYIDGERDDKLFKSIVDLGKAAAGEKTEYALSYKQDTPASSGKGAEEGASLRFTGKNLLMNDTIALRLYGTTDNTDAVEGLKVIFNNKYNVTHMCEISTPVYSEEKGVYTFTVDIFFSTNTMEEAVTITINDSEGKLCLELNDRIDWVAQMILAKEPDNALAKQVLIYIQSINDYLRKDHPVITPTKPGDETEIGDKVEI